MGSVLRTGVDMIEIQRIQQAVERFGERFLGRIFTSAELACCQGQMESLAARFAGKEAVVKALGTGSWRAGICWTDVEILRDDQGAPRLRLHNQAAQKAHQLGLAHWSISLSHDRERAIAFVVALGSD